MEMGEFIEKASLKKVAPGIFAGNSGYYRLYCWSEDWQDKGRRTRPESLSPTPGEGERFVLPSRGKARIYKLHGDARAIQYISLWKIPEEGIERLRRQLGDHLRKADLQTILAAAEAVGMNTGKFIHYPDMF